MEFGEYLTRLSVRTAVALYVASLFLWAWPRSSRLAWSVGCLCYLLHVAAAFHYFHHWSQDDAWNATANQTAAVTGLDWGGGLYVNYAFTFVWLADACWWWVNAESYRRRPTWLTYGMHGFMGFIVFNATVVFAHGWSRWFGIAACIGLAGSACAVRRNRSR